MKKDCPSTTALRVAWHRAAHQVLDDPRVFHDPLALLILGENDRGASQPDSKWLDRTELAKEAKKAGSLRAFLAARSRYAEDELHAAVKRGVRQYVVLGAGLDTFAYRNPYPEGGLRVFEVDHPDTQIWKSACLEEAGILVPRTLTFSPVDFENSTLEEGLLDTGFDRTASTFFSWLGVTQYLSISAVHDTLRFVSSMPAGSAIVFDYTISPSLLGPAQRQAFDSLARRVAMAGEPFETFFDPDLLKTTLRDMGFGLVDDLDTGKINDLYFRGRTDGLSVRGFTHVMNARV
ncbi:conserved hypothetical protein [Syntrophobacter sp. SbD1]|nr:conserved hypothetical protein [Syntrophobacter sp. SbD1]